MAHYSVESNCLAHTKSILHCTTACHVEMPQAEQNPPSQLAPNQLFSARTPSPTTSVPIQCAHSGLTKISRCLAHGEICGPQCDDGAPSCCSAAPDAPDGAAPPRAGRRLQQHAGRYVSRARASSFRGGLGGGRQEPGAQTPADLRKTFGRCILKGSGCCIVGVVSESRGTWKPVKSCTLTNSRLHR